MGTVLFLTAGCGNNASNPAAPGSPNTYPFSFSFGSNGTGNGQFINPWGLLIFHDALFVADGGNHRVVKLDLNGNFLGSYTLNSLSKPTGLAVDKNGVIYVVDHNNSNLQTMDMNGNYIATLGTPGLGLGQFTNPFGIAVDGSGRIYVADASNNRIQRCDPSNMPSSCVTLGGPVNGMGNGQFNEPYGVVLDAGGNLWVADTFNNRVQEFDSSLVYQSQFGSSSVLLYPKGVFIDAQGNVIVADGYSRVQVFTTSGSLLREIGHFLFNQAVGLAQSSDGRLYVSDSTSNIVRVFNPN